MLCHRFRIIYPIPIDISTTRKSFSQPTGFQLQQFVVVDLQPVARLAASWNRWWWVASSPSHQNGTAQGCHRTRPTFAFWAACQKQPFTHALLPAPNPSVPCHRGHHSTWHLHASVSTSPTTAVTLITDDSDSLAPHRPAQFRLPTIHGTAPGDGSAKYPSRLAPCHLTSREYPVRPPPFYASQITSHHDLLASTFCGLPPLQGAARYCNVREVTC